VQFPRRLSLNTLKSRGFSEYLARQPSCNRVRHDARRAAAPLCLHHAQCAGSRPATHRPDGRHGLATGIAQCGRITVRRAARPWQIVVLVQFVDERRALAVERFLKSTSGRAFARQYLCGGEKDEVPAF
jgi:hypothetical protein